MKNIDCVSADHSASLRTGSVSLRNLLCLPQPGWILNDINEDFWVFRRDVGGYSSSHFNFNWNWPDSVGLDLGRSEYWKAIGKKYTYWYMESRNTKCTRTSSLITMARNIRPLLIWLDCERSCAAISDIGRDDVTAYEEYLQSLDLSQDTVTAKLSVFKLFWTLRLEAGEGMAFDAYPKNGSLLKRGKNLGSPGGHTPTLEPKILFRLVDHAINIVNESEEFVDYVCKYFCLRYPRSGMSSGHDGTRFFRMRDAGLRESLERLRVLYGACLVLIFVLHANRKHELAELTLSSLRGLSEDPPILYGRVKKTANTFAGEETVRPVPPELAKALMVVKNITDFARDYYGVDALFVTIPSSMMSTSSCGSSLDSGQIYRLLNVFGRSAGVAVKIRPHMFRRAFSMLYVWRYELGDLTNLSVMLFHKNINYTLAYVNEQSLSLFLPEAEKTLSYEIMMASLLGGRALGGGFGKRLEQIKARLASTVTLISPARAASYLEKLIYRDGLTIKPSEHGYCVMSGTRAKNAKCSTDGLGPDLVNRIHDHCVACSNFFVHEGFVSYWESQLESHSVVYASTENIFMRKVAARGIKHAIKILTQIRGVNV